VKFVVDKAALEWGFSFDSTNDPYLRLIHTCHAAPMPRLCGSPGMPCRVNSHIPCRASAIFRQCCVFCGTPRGSRKELNAGRSPTCRLWTTDANSHIPCHTYAAPVPRCAVDFRSRFQNGTGATWHCVNQTRTHCINQMGKTPYKPLAARHGRGTAWERHGIYELDFIPS
jgi:hypothetical protein